MALSPLPESGGQAKKPEAGEQIVNRSALGRDTGSEDADHKKARWKARHSSNRFRGESDSFVDNLLAHAEA